MNNNKLIAEFMGVKPPLYMEYHTSWDWLIPVVAKCTELNDDEFDNQSIAWALLSDSIIDAYDHVVDFIKAYTHE
jgi:hypothetical protein